MSGDESCVFGENAPKSEVLGLISRLVNEPGYPIYVLYVAGHGYADLERLVPYGDWVLRTGFFDTRNAEPYTVSLNDVLGIWANSAARNSGGKFVIISDVCHSGCWVFGLEKLNAQGQFKDVAIQASVQINEYADDGYFTERFVKKQSSRGWDATSNIQGHHHHPVYTAAWGPRGGQVKQAPISAGMALVFYQHHQASKDAPVLYEAFKREILEQRGRAPHAQEQSVWQRHQDQASGRYFHYNTLTGESRWA